MRKNSVFACTIVMLAVFAGIASAGDLDGKTFVASVADPNGEAMDDTLTFADGMFDSVACHEWGFGKGAYTVEKTDHGWTFTAATSSETEGEARWKGTVSGDTISGTMEWAKPGQDPVVYEFSGKLQS